MSDSYGHRGGEHAVEAEPPDDASVRFTGRIQTPWTDALVRPVHIDGPVLVVRGLDCLDGTPLLDTKPDRCAYSPKAPPKNATPQ